MLDFVNLEDLEIDERVAEMVEEYGRQVPMNYHLYDCGTFPLNKERLERLLELNTEDLPPIYVKKTSGYHKVLNGRHRIATAILNNQTSVNVVYTN